jgi:hypothetical protein
MIHACTAKEPSHRDEGAANATLPLVALGPLTAQRPRGAKVKLLSQSTIQIDRLKLSRQLETPSSRSIIETIRFMIVNESFFCRIPVQFAVQFAGELRKVADGNGAVGD